MQTQDYQQQCEKFVKEWIDKNTWHKAKNVSLHIFEFANADLSISVKHTFKVEKRIEKDSINNLGQNSRDKIYNTQWEYNQAIQNHINTCHSNENLKILYNILQKSDYGIFKKDTVFKINNQRIIHKYKCPKCNGKGTIKCNCRGGKVQCNAWGCKDGRIKKSKYEKGRTIT